LNKKYVALLALSLATIIALSSFTLFLTNENDALRNERDNLKNEVASLVEQRTMLEGTKRSLEKELGPLNQLKSDIEGLQKEIDKLQAPNIIATPFLIRPITNQDCIWIQGTVANVGSLPAENIRFHLSFTELTGLPEATIKLIGYGSRVSVYEIQHFEIENLSGETLAFVSYNYPIDSLTHPFTYLNAGASGYLSWSYNGTSYAKAVEITFK
jgi:cell division protein FtsB